MAKARSPQYPAISLKEAIEKVRAVYDNDYQNPISRSVVAKHMGYNGLNGKSLGVLSAVGKFGLLEGRGDETRVSDLAVRIIAHPTGTPERAEAITEAAGNPELFAELDARYPNGKASEQAIRSYLLTQKFIKPAADAATRTYLETKDFVCSETRDVLPSEQTCEPAVSAMGSAYTEQTSQKIIANQAPEPVPELGVRKAVFALTEGDVTITFPEGLSPESVLDLSDYLDIFLKKAKREAGISASGSSQSDT
jgi:hypothetical protein